MIERLLERLVKALSACRIPYMIIGGQAVLYWGFPRLTQDLDVTLGVDTDALDDLKAVCRQAGFKPMIKNVESFVRDTHVLPAKDPTSGLRVDFVFSNTPYERQAIRRARNVRMGKVTVKFASLEDVLIHKLVAGRALDVEDARVLIQKHRAAIDAKYVRSWLKKFASLETLKENPLKAFDGLYATARP